MPASSNPGSRRPAAGSAIAVRRSSFIDFRVRKSIVLMSEQLGSEIELDEVARDAGLSRPHFYKLFRRQTGVTPNIYLNTLRMERAVQRLGQTDHSITDIGYELGFSCQSVFTRFFSLACRDGADRLPARRAGAATARQLAAPKRRYWRS